MLIDKTKLIFRYEKQRASSYLVVILLLICAEMFTLGSSVAIIFSEFHLRAILCLARGIARTCLYRINSSYYVDKWVYFFSEYTTLVAHFSLQSVVAVFGWLVGKINYLRTLSKLVADVKVEMTLPKVRILNRLIVQWQKCCTCL